ncbi:MAG TPA: hypothetical protein VEW11_05965 [Gaiellaceae bacterium]|nr:hypothetical protein [Gaiellaceae bacterium]
MLVLAGCGSADSITIELEQVNGSGVSGTIELTPVGERATRITVRDVAGGYITGARIMPDGSCPGLDDKYPITPPTGIVQIDFDELRHWDDDHAVLAEFLRRGRYVACGTT